MAWLRLALRDWVADNPFVRLALRQRLGHGRIAWRGWIVVLTALLVLLGWELLTTIAGWRDHPTVRAGPGPLLLGVVTAVALIVSGVEGAKVFALAVEHAADRLEPLRLVPMGRRELLVKIGIARTVIALIEAVWVFPVGAILLAYGGIRPTDLVTWYLLVVGCVLGSPSAAEIRAAYVARIQAAAQGKQASGRGWIWWAVTQGVLQSLRGVGRMGWWSDLRAWVAGAMGAEWGRFFPFTVVPVGARLLVVPAPWFRGAVAPLFTLGLVWLVGRLRRAVGAAEFWAREPTLRIGTGGGAQGAKSRLLWFPEVTGHPNERRLADGLACAQACLLLLAVAGHGWAYLATGTLGRMIRDPTPAGSVAALAMLFGAWSLMATLYHWCAPAEEGFRVSGPEHARRLAIRLVALAATALLASAIGGAWAGGAVVGAFAPLAAIGVSGFLFAGGWQALATRLAREEVAERAPVWPWSWRIGLALFLLVPPVVWFLAPQAELHLLAGFSPFYAWLVLFAGQFAPRVASGPLPFALAVALPALFGIAAAMVARSAARTPKAAAPSRRPVREEEALSPWGEWLVARVRAIVARIDNPILSLEWNRQQRSPSWLADGTALTLLFCLPGVFAILSLMMALARSADGVPLAQATSVVLRDLLWPWGRPAALAYAVAGNLLTMIALASWGAVVQTRIQQLGLAYRMAQLTMTLVSPLSDRALLVGPLLAGTLAALPFLVGALIFGLIWLLVGLIAGAPAWTAALWLWTVVTGVVWVVGNGLRGTWWVFGPAGCFFWLLFPAEAVVLGLWGFCELVGALAFGQNPWRILAPMLAWSGLQLALLPWGHWRGLATIALVRRSDLATEPAPAPTAAPRWHAWKSGALRS